MRGMKWITKMVMDMVLVLTVVLMETPEGGWRSLPEVIRRRFPPPIFSGDSLLTLCFVVLCFSAASSRNSSGDYFYSRF